MASKRGAADEAAFQQEEAELDAALAGDASGLVPTGASDRSRLKNGEIDAQAFLDLQVERALSPYLGSLDAELIGAMRQVLRAQFEQDPQLADLAARATQIES